MHENTFRIDYSGFPKHITHGDYRLLITYYPFTKKELGLTRENCCALDYSRKASCLVDRYYGNYENFIHTNNLSSLRQLQVLWVASLFQHIQNSSSKKLLRNPRTLITFRWRLCLIRSNGLVIRSASICSVGR